jgi:DNA-binding response OmpR family regulator
LGEPKRILIVDDDSTVSETLSLLLEQEGYAVDVAANGKEAVDKSNKNFYNLAIVDWRLPDVKGTQLLGMLKETTPKIVKIMLTGFPSIENAIDSVNAQANAFLQKPVNGDVLLNKISDLLKQQEEFDGFTEEKMVTFIETRTKQLLKNRKDGE